MSIAATVFNGLYEQLHRSGLRRSASRRSCRRSFSANVRIALPTVSISAAYLRRIEPGINFAVTSQQVGSWRLLAPKVFATQPTLSRVHSSQIVRKMQTKSAIDLVRIAHALDVISVVGQDASMHQAPTDALLSRGDNHDAFKCTDEFFKSNRPLSTSCLIVDVLLLGVTRRKVYQHRAATANSPILLTINQLLAARQASVSHSLTRPARESELLACMKFAAQSQTVHGSQS